MKKLTITGFLLFLFIFNLQAQNLGFKITPNFTLSNQDGNWEEKFVTGFQTGIFYEVFSQRRINIETGMNYNFYNSKSVSSICLDLGGDFCTSTRKRQYQFLEIPAVLKFNLYPNEQKLKTRLVVGYSFSRLMSVREIEKYQEENVKEIIAIKGDVLDDYIGHIYYNKIHLGVEFASSFGTRFNFYLQPAYSYTFKNEEKSSYYNDYKNLRIDFKLSYSLKGTSQD